MDLKPVEPGPDGEGYELGAVVRADMLRRTVPHEQFAKHVRDILAVELALHIDRQTRPAVRVDHRQYPEGTAVMGAVLDEVVRPDMIAMGRTQPDAGAAVQPNRSSTTRNRWISDIAARQRFQPMRWVY